MAADDVSKREWPFEGGEQEVGLANYFDETGMIYIFEDAVSFYEKIGMKRADEVMKYNHIEWTEWTVQ